MSTVPKERLAKWRSLAESGLPEEDEAIERNRAISARYARLYLLRPREFKWAGMAAFASHNVGLALKGKILALAELDDDLAALSRGNNAIYRDVAWAHVAYYYGGAAEVAACLGISPASSVTAPSSNFENFEMIQKGFEHIERGHAASDIPMIWIGNEALLEHEQKTTVQPYFERLDDDFAYFLTLVMSFDLDGDPVRIDWKTLSSFVWTMVSSLRGLRILFETRSLPDIRIARHRWFWAQSSLLPIWRKAEQAGSAKAQLERLADSGE